VRWLVAILPLVVACSTKRAEDAAPSGSASAGSAPAAAPKASVRAPEKAPGPGESVEIPGGAFFAGSLPGEPGRKPELEPRRYEVELGPYRIDRLPYPNDPSRPALTGVSRDEAKRLCAERSARLCSELEWERACKGPTSDVYATGADWDPRCSDEPRICATGFELLGMGAAIREWTSSDIVPSEPKAARRAAIRGAPPKAAAPDHRCAARRGIDASTQAEDLGFRCCHGAPNAAAIPEPKLGTTFEKRKLTAARLEQLLAADPRTATLARDVKFFRDPEAANTVVSRGPGDRKGFTFGVTPLVWNPVAGGEYLLVAARTGDTTSFVVAFHVLGDDSYQLAASFVMKNEPGPIAFAYDAYIRPRLHFSSCWGCPGETGKILYRDPDTVSILQP
jgi:hypothetical protein